MKYVLYDWFGLNQWLFLLINGHYGEAFDRFMLAIMPLGDHHNFKYYLIAFTLIGIIKVMIDGRRTGALPWRERARPTIAMLTSMTLGYMLCGLTIGISKAVFKMPRPFVTLRDPSYALHFAGPYPDFEDYYASFPSGHAATIWFLVALWWPVMPPAIRIITAIIAVLVCWSRLAIAMHYPIDIIIGGLIGAGSAIVVRRFICRYMSVTIR